MVVDASAAISGLLNAGPARQVLAEERLHVPHLIDSELVNGLRRAVASSLTMPDDAWAAIERWRQLGMTRHGGVALFERVWALRQNLSAYDACYVALAESLGCPLMTADARLGRAPGLRCPVTVVPR